MRNQFVVNTLGSTKSVQFLKICYLKGLHWLTKIFISLKYQGEKIFHSYLLIERLLTKNISMSGCLGQETKKKNIIIMHDLIIIIRRKTR